MADYQAILEEEFEVLESIFPEELEKVSEREVRIRIEPEDPSPSNPLVLVLVVSYPDTYPDVIPDLQVESLDEDSGELDDDEEEKFLSDLRSTAEESIGMAMTFTIASMAREALTTLIEDRITREREEDERKTRAYEEAELERTRGTPLTPDAFNTWRKSFTAELQRKREKEEEDRIKAMAPKEREEYKRRRERLTGKQLFLTSKTLATSDEALYEEGDSAVDMSKYSREEREAERRREEDEEERRRRGLVNAEDSD